VGWLSAIYKLYIRTGPMLYTDDDGQGCGWRKTNKPSSPNPLATTTTSRLCAPVRPLISGFFLRQKPDYADTTATIVSNSAGVYSSIRTCVCVCVSCVHLPPISIPISYTFQHNLILCWYIILLLQLGHFMINSTFRIHLHSTNENKYFYTLTSVDFQ